MAKASVIDLSGYLSTLNVFLQSGEGKNIIRDAVRSGVGGGKGGHAANGVSVNGIKDIAEELKKMIVAMADTEFQISQLSVYNHIRCMEVENIRDNGDGSYTAELNLSGDMSRPSLNPFSDGAYNIVSLFIHGWTDRNDRISKLFGKWHGELTFARTYKEPMRFLHEAVDQFNAMYNSVGISATIGSEYF